MKILTRTIQETNTADFVILEFDPEYADWCLGSRKLLHDFRRNRPQNTARWFVCDDSQATFLKTKECQYTGLDQYLEQIKNDFFVVLPDFFELPKTVKVTPPPKPARDGEESTPNEPIDKELAAKMARVYMTIDNAGIAWHGGADTYGRRAVSTPRMSYDLLAKLTGLTMPADLENTTEGSQSGDHVQQGSVDD